MALEVCVFNAGLIGAGNILSFELFWFISIHSGAITVLVALTFLILFSLLIFGDNIFDNTFLNCIR